MGLLSKLFRKDKVEKMADMPKNEQEQENKRKELQAALMPLKKEAGMENLTEEEQKEFLEFEKLLDERELNEEEEERKDYLSLKFLWREEANIHKHLVRRFLKEQRKEMEDKLIKENTQSLEEVA